MRALSMMNGVAVVAMCGGLPMMEPPAPPHDSGCDGQVVFTIAIREGGGFYEIVDDPGWGQSSLREVDAQGRTLTWASYGSADAWFRVVDGEVQAPSGPILGEHCTYPKGTPAVCIDGGLDAVRTHDEQGRVTHLESRGYEAALTYDGEHLVEVYRANARTTTRYEWEDDRVASISWTMTRTYADPVQSWWPNGMPRDVQYQDEADRGYGFDALGRKAYRRKGPLMAHSDHDARGRLTRESTWRRNQKGTSMVPLAEHTYDGSGRMVSAERAQGRASTGLTRYEVTHRDGPDGLRYECAKPAT